MLCGGLWIGTNSCMVCVLLYGVCFVCYVCSIVRCTFCVVCMFACETYFMWRMFCMMCGFCCELDYFDDACFV